MNRVTFPLSSPMTGPAVADLQAALMHLLPSFVTDSSMRRRIATAVQPEISAQSYGTATEALVALFQEALWPELPGKRPIKPSATGIVDLKTANALNERLADLGELDEPSPSKSSQLEGYIFLEYGLPAESLKLRLYQLIFGGQSVFLCQTFTDVSGRYLFKYPADLNKKMPLKLEVRAVASSGNMTKLSKPVDISPGQVPPDLNLIAPAALRPLGAEYTRLVSDLTPQIGNLSKLANAKETTAQPDLTILNRATGWDARLLACAAKAQRLSSSDLSAEGLYGLFRAGLPMEISQLVQVDPDVIDQTLTAVRDAGIISLSTQQMTQFKQAFTAFANTVRLSAKMPGSNSTYEAMLQASGLSLPEQETFKDVYLSHRGSSEELWKRAREAGLGEEPIGKLQFQGKIAYLTSGNEPLMGRLQQTIITGEPAQFVEQGFYRAEKWISEIYATANLSYPPDPETPSATLTQLKNSIPPAFDANTLDEQIQLWAEDMAHKVEVSYPTHVLADKIKNDTNDKFNFGATKETTAQVLKRAASRGFQLGKTPISIFFKESCPEIQGDLTESDFATAKSNIATLQCLAQIAPNETAIRVLKNLDINSAYDVTSLNVSEFTQCYVEKSLQVNPNVSRELAIEEAALLHGRAKQISNVIYNIFGIIQGLSSNAPVAGISSSTQGRESVKNELIKHFPSMESLFGSMDFSEIDQSCSVLGPAAYLTDLLQLIDVDDRVWSHFLTEWNKTHGSDQIYSANYKKPYDALIERRPDLPHIKFTSENTNTALPYIDLVNEILEYYVAYNKLEDAAAHDTGEASTAELLAEPQNIIHEAYEKLRAAQYPLTLPFDLWLETVRAFCDYFEMPFGRVLEALRPTDKLIDSAKTYDRAAIFLESLKLSPAEIELFTKADPLVTWFELYGFDNAADAMTEMTDFATGQRIDLNSAKTLSRRLGVSYKQLVELVQTAFINPKLAELEEESAPRDQILLLVDQNAGANFDTTILRYADGRPADALAFLKFNLFVRLWRKLGWTIEETDCALRAFLPADARFEGETAKTALIYLAHLKTLEEQLSLGSQSRVKLTTLWANIPTTGKNSLYAQLFLTHSALKSDDAFEHLDGQSLKDHLPALQGALGLTADEIRRIFEDAGESMEAAELSLDNISLLYRYGLFAKGLNISVRELIAFKQLSGIDPFKPLHAGPLFVIEEDYPFSQTLRFVEVVQKVKESSFTVEDLDYLLRHRFDETGKYRPNREAMLVLLKTLSDGIRAIRSENAMPTDPGAMSDDWFRQKLALLVPSEVAERFLAMMNGTVEFTATLSGIAPTDQLRLEAFSNESSLRELVYNEMRQEQKLTYRGVLLEEEKAALLGRLAEQVPSNPYAHSEILRHLLDDVEQQARAFFEKNLQKQPAEIQPAAGFLDATDYSLLFVAAPTGMSEADLQERHRQQRSRLAEAFLPVLQESLIRQFVVRMLTAHTMAEPVLTESLLTDARLLCLTEFTGVEPVSLATTLMEAGDRGLNVSFFTSSDGTGDALSTFVFPEADTGLKEKNQALIPPEAVMSASFEGYLEVPIAGAYRFYVELDKQGAAAEIHFVDLPGALFLSDPANENGAEMSEYFELKPGILYHFIIKLKNLGGGDARVRVQGKTIPKGKLSQLALYPFTSLSAAERAVILLTKVLALAQGFALNEREIRYLLTHAGDFGGLDFKKIPTRAEGDSSSNIFDLFKHFLRLLEYVRLRSAIAEGTDDLIDVFEVSKAEYKNKKQAWAIWILSYGNNKIAAIKGVRDVIPTYELKEAKNIIDEIPSILYINTCSTAEEIDAVMQTFKANVNFQTAEATFEMRPYDID